uniref:Serpentine receptor class gamma n=1 Tax=Caenorhabditis tropicalis TaxID=1561998 RepID=A0A1I7TCD3_9PELO
MMLQSSEIIRMGERKVLFYLLIVTISCLAMYIVYETIISIDWGKDVIRVINLLKVLSVTNYLPEVLLTMLFLIENLKIKKTIYRFLRIRVEERSIITT